MSDTPAGRLAPSNFQNQDNRQTRPVIVSLALTGYDKISAGGLTCTVSMSQASGAWAILLQADLLVDTFCKGIHLALTHSGWAVRDKLTASRIKAIGGPAQRSCAVLTDKLRQDLGWRADLHSERESSLRSMSNTPSGRLAPSYLQNQDNRQTRPAIASLVLTGYDRISAGGLTCKMSMSQASGA
jgi:Tfp pilus assembly protein PilW